jgi:hypothetical protein
LVLLSLELVTMCLINCFCELLGFYLSVYEKVYFFIKFFSLHYRGFQ